MAITFVEGGVVHPGGSVAMSQSVAIGDLLVVSAFTPGGLGGSVTNVFSDTINSGNWTSFAHTYEGGRQYDCAYIVCNATGVPTVSSTESNTINPFMYVAHYTGFVGTATWAGDFNINYESASATTAVSGTSINTSKAQELFCAFGGSFGGTAWGTAPAAPFVSRIAYNSAFNAGVYLYDQIVSTAGTATNLTGTLASGDEWYVTQAGFYDKTSSAPPSSMFLTFP